MHGWLWEGCAQPWRTLYVAFLWFACAWGEMGCILWGLSRSPRRSRLGSSHFGGHYLLQASGCTWVRGTAIGPFVEDPAGSGGAAGGWWRPDQDGAARLCHALPSAGKSALCPISGADPQLLHTRNTPQRKYLHQASHQVLGSELHLFTSLLKVQGPAFSPLPLYRLHPASPGHLRLLILLAHEAGAQA